MFELNDITFLFAVRIDSQDRLNNLVLNIRYLQKHLRTRILIGEEGPPYQLQVLDLSLDNCLEIIELPKFHQTLFWKTRITNHLVKKLVTTFGATVDADVLFYPSQYLAAYKLLRTGSASFVFPFDSPTKRIPRELHHILAGDSDLMFFSHLANSNNEVATGGSLFFDSSAFLSCGLENERIIGWGPEDNERYRRIRKLNHRVSRVRGPLFHLEHRRSKPSRKKHQFTKTNEKECARIESLGELQLAEEVRTWPWI